MKRRAFISMMLGAAGAPLVPWRGLVAPVIVLPAWEMTHVCAGSFWCNHPSHLKPSTPRAILADIESSFERMGLRRFTPTHASVDWHNGQISLGGYYGPPMTIPHSPQLLAQGSLP